MSIQSVVCSVAIGLGLGIWINKKFKKTVKEEDIQKPQEKEKYRLVTELIVGPYKTKTVADRDLKDAMDTITDAILEYGICSINDVRAIFGMEESGKWDFYGWKTIADLEDVRPFVRKGSDGYYLIFTAKTFVEEDLR